jgi:NAD(P)-dependent dehydrogenase (short-subunit alcohol dehydrogenase family)
VRLLSGDCAGRDGEHSRQMCCTRMSRKLKTKREVKVMSILKGKIALVTGAGGKRGMGHTIALRFAREGADVAVVDKDAAPRSLFPGDEGWKGLDTVVAEIESLDRKALAVVADVSSSREVDAAVAKTLESFGKIDILVHCAAIRGPVTTPVIELAEGDWRRVLDVNLDGTFFVAKGVAKSMVARGEGGKIVLISSMGGVKGMPGSAAYCVSKFGVVGLVKTLALELAKHKIYVNAINPGAVTSNLRDSYHIEKGRAEGITVDKARERDYQKMSEGIPLGRMGTTEEIADLVLFLASDQSSYITGEAINISGGIS